jgi:cyclopropane fatty-acyl-phospholipid synthase-like methyltransferase
MDMIASGVSSKRRGAMSDKQSEQDGEDRLRSQIEAYHATALAYAAVKLGLPETMGSRSWTADKLAAELSLSPPHLLRFLRGLATLGICEERSDRTFALGPLGQSLAAGSPSRLGEKVAIVVEQYWGPWADLVLCLKTGNPSFDHVFGKNVWDWRRGHNEQGATFDTYLAEETFAQGEAIAEALDWSDAHTIADIGGGYGGLLAAILRAQPQLAGLLFDTPETVAQATPFLASVGVADRVTLVAGDFFAEIPVQADRYLLKGVLQQWDNAEAIVILRKCRAAMSPRAKLLVVERLLPKRALDDADAVMIDLHMMVINGGRARTLAEIDRLIADAGLAISTVTPTKSGLSIVETIPA